MKRRKLYPLLQKVYELLDGIILKEEFGKNDAWHEFYDLEGNHSITIQIESDGFHMLDGDPICGWCGNTFDKKYPFDVSPSTIANKIKFELLVNQPRLWKEYKDHEENREKKFSAIMKDVLGNIPKTIKHKYTYEFQHAKFWKGKKMVLLKMDGEFDDIWLTGYDKVKVRKRWAESEYNPKSISSAIKEAVSS